MLNRVLFAVFLYLVVGTNSTPVQLSGEPSSTFTIDITEHGTTFQQRVTNAYQLQILEVPKHNEREQVIVYLDFESHFELIKRIEAKECLLSSLDAKFKHSTTQPTGRQIPMFRAAEITVIEHPKLIIDKPMVNINFLRKELRDACEDWPVFWADNKPQPNENGEVGVFHVNSTQYVFANARGSTSQCSAIDTSRPPAQQQGTQFESYSCSSSCQYQMCYPNIASNCYYLIICGPSNALSQSCVQHITNPLGYCRLCCTDSRYTCDLNWKVKRCDCPNIYQGSTFPHG